MTLMMTALTLLGAFFVWSAQRWIDNVEAQASALERKQVVVERASDVMAAKFDVIISDLQEIKARVVRIEERIK
jgi:hypothetical protein